MKRKVRLVNETVRGSIIQDIEALECDGKHNVTISEYRAKRSLEQNDRLHKLLGMLAEFTGESLEQEKLNMKARFLEPVAQVQLDSGRVWVQYKSTAAMTVKELTDFMEKVEAFMAVEVGITLPVRDWEDAR